MNKPVKNKRVRCSKGFLALVAALVYLDGQGLVFYVVLAAIMHEIGHWLLIRILGGKIESISLAIVGVEMKLAPQCPLSYGREAIAALAGPVVNLYAAWIAIKFGWYIFGGIHLCFGVLNLVPIFPLDGGRILACLLSIKSLTWAEKVTKMVSIIFSGLLLGLGLAAWKWWGNVALLITALWLTFSAIKQ